MYLSAPPPPTSVHVMVQPKGLVFIEIMSLRREDEDWCEFRVAPQGSYAFNYVTKIEIVCTVGDHNLMTFEARAGSRELFVDDGIEFADILEREAKLLNDLESNSLIWLAFAIDLVALSHI